MTLRKAIEILRDLLHGDPPADPEDRRDAVDMAISGLLRVEHCRKWDYRAIHRPLDKELPG